ncbi:aldo/keto reductase [Labrys wisconsinensis]|uniref:2,5-diketo-D-gluconate reductase A n=1 Tax=Labrys wisconsinensis TaxID=425677 RepID=A0ABU0J9X2_9HYPH|nr:aldo/keto reductase [Labrys wisconsinensis]MDQ0470248.1 2,5-diketo-D-gluconate reductase A [Labrys wisconsinensis]
MTTSLVLNDGQSIPQLGFGVWQVPNDGAAVAVGTAIKAGYRLIDTAAIYGNETGVGEAIAAASVPREDLFITTKLWNDRQGYDSTLRAFDESMKRLRLEGLDLYLIHWPAAQRGAYVDTWRAFARLKEEGRVRSIGVSNFTIAHLERLQRESGIVPAVNQVELHPRFQQTALRRFQEKAGIATESWSPLGQGTLLQDPVLKAIAARHGKTTAQVIIRWHLDSGLIVIPKSVTPARIRENFDVFDFELSPEDKAGIAGLDDPRGRIGPDPDRFSN